MVSLLPRADHSDEARLWGSAQEWHTHCLASWCYRKKKHTFCGKEKNVPICRSWVRWGGETLIWDCVDLERWSHSENSYRSKEPKMTSVLKDTPKYDE